MVSGIDQSSYQFAHNFVFAAEVISSRTSENMVSISEPVREAAQVFETLESVIHDACVMTI